MPGTRAPDIQRMTASKESRRSDIHCPRRFAGSSTFPAFGPTRRRATENLLTPNCGRTLHESTLPHTSPTEIWEYAYAAIVQESERAAYGRHRTRALHEGATALAFISLAEL